MLIGCALGGIGFQIPKWIKREKYEKSVARVHSKIALAQEMMVDYATDVTITFDKEEEGISCYFNPSPTLPEKLRSLINRDYLLEGIGEISLDDNTNYPLHLHFSASSYTTPEATLTLKGIKTTSLYLPGYPAAITKTPPPQKGKSISHEPPYPQEV